MCAVPKCNSVLLRQLDRGRCKTGRGYKNSVIGAVMDFRHPDELLDVRRINPTARRKSLALNHGVVSLGRDSADVGGEIVRSADVFDVPKPQVVEQGRDSQLECGGCQR